MILPREQNIGSVATGQEETVNIGNAYAKRRCTEHLVRPLRHTGAPECRRCEVAPTTPAAMGVSIGFGA
ncbi:MAG TPA: hypothetical protein VIJ34_11435, partial [Acidimicrobiales bacterium]